MKKKIKVGVLINSQKVNAWEYKMLNEIFNSDYAEIKLFIIQSLSKRNVNLFKVLFEQKDNLFYKLFTEIENKIIKLKQNPFEKKSITNFSSVPLYIMSSNKTEDIIKFDLDVIINLGLDISKSDILKTTKFGIWSYYHGDISIKLGGPPGFWEVMENWGETGSVLQILMKDSEAKNLYRSYSLTDPHSVVRNISKLLWKSTMFIPRKLRELYIEGEENFFSNIKNQNKYPKFYSNKLFKIPGNFEMIYLLCKLLIKYLKEKISNIFYKNQWHLQYQISKNNTLPTIFFGFKKIIPPKDRYWADPNFIKKNERYYIFFEEYIYSRKKGHISCIELDVEGNCSFPQIVLKKDYHLSFPFVFKVEDNILYDTGNIRK